MTIREPGAGGASDAAGATAAEPIDADEDFARQLQAKMDAADARRCASWPCRAKFARAQSLGRVR